MSDKFHKRKKLRTELWKLRKENSDLKKQMVLMKKILDFTIATKWSIK